MSVHYKFKSALEYDTVTFDGLHISVKDLKIAIIQQKRIGKSTDFDLQVTNAQTKEVYEDENALIPKNTSLLIARIPVIPQKTKQWEGYGGDNTPPSKVDEGGPIAKAVDLSSLDAPEDDKIKAMMSQSTQDYDPSNYIKIRGSNQVGAVPLNYKCYKCHQSGHWIKDCTYAQGPDPVEIRKSTGIPQSFMVAVEGPQVPGAMMTPNGQFAVPLVDHQAYTQKPVPTPVPEPKLEIPEELVCGICSDLLTDAVMIPCCGNSFCDECIRGVLLESEDHECPDCHEKDISPDTLIPNRFLRKSVANFKNTTGYVKKQIYKEPDTTNLNQIKGSTPPPREVVVATTVENETEQKTVISEADSTESSKNNQNTESSKETDNNDAAKSIETESIEGPPGVSPKRSPKVHSKRRDESPKESRSPPKETRQRSSRTRHKSRDRSASPRSSRRRRSPSFGGSGSPEKRSGTPTIDEQAGKYNPPVSYNNSMPPIMGQSAPIQPIQGGYPPVQPPMGAFPPPAQGPLPNYRFPPPGTTPYMPSGPYNVPPRPMFDANRPPLGGPPSNFNPNFPPGSRGHRDYGRRMIDRAPAGVIDDPLAAFNRLLREKDEQKRRAKQRTFRRSYSRSRSRSFSRSPVRRRSRSPRPNRRSRSRSRSFSLSRSRSRSFSGSLRGSPHRQLSPPRRSPPPLNTRRGASRYRSPLRSPPRTRHRDRDYDDDRDYNNRDERPFKDNRRNRDNRDRRSRDRDRYFDNFDDKRCSQQRQQQPWGQQTMPPRQMQDGYYPPQAMQQGYQTNRFGQGPPRDYGPPFMNKEPPFNQPIPQTIHNIQPQRQYQDIAPPGVDDDIAPPGVEEPPFNPERKGSPKGNREIVPSEKRSDRKESDKSNDRKRRHEKRSRTPDKARNPSPKIKSKSRDENSPEKPRRRRRNSSDKEDRDKNRDHSDDERSKKSKDKKKHRDKKESEKKKKRDKKDKHKKEGKEKKPKDEFKQIIPKNADEDENLGKKLPTKKKRGEMEELELGETRLKEEKRLEAIKEEKRLEDVKEENGLKTLREEKRPEQEKKKIQENVDKREHGKLKQIDQEVRRISIEERKEYTPEPEEPKPDLYGEISTEDIDTAVMENYGKLENELSFEGEEDYSQPNQEDEPEDTMEEGEIKEFEDEEKDVLELHTTDMDLKTEIDKSDILAPVPEKSKWEVDEDGVTSPKDSNKSDSRSDKSGKVTNEVLKRAENAIFAKAINAIRPIEIKKIGADRAKLYSGERDVEKISNQYQATIGSGVVKNDPVQQPTVRLSAKERLGVKVEDTDKVINLSRRSRTISPFSKRGESGRNFSAGERRVEVDEFRNRNRRSRSRRRENSRDRRRIRNDTRHHSRHDKNNDRKREKSKKEEKSKHDDENKKSKRKRSRSRSESEDKKDKHKKKEKKPKKEKLKKKEDNELKEKVEKDEPQPQVATKRKATIDEATFEPDYDESHSDDDKEKKKVSKKESDSSTSESDSDSSSEEERKKKKHKKHKKRKKRETSSSSSSSSSESESSESEKERKKRKHKKSKKKKKKSKHK